jgi:GAF domain-containing protein
MGKEDRPIRILLIEDNPGDARLLQEMLVEARGLSFELEQRESLSTGLEWLAEGNPDVVLLDLSLPDSQGFNTVTQVLAQAPQAPIVVLSGLDDEDLAVSAVRVGAQDYLVKGQVSSDLLARAIHYAIERKRAEARQAYYLQTEYVLRQISSRFADLRSLGQAVNEALGDMGIALNTDRAQFFGVGNEGGQVSCMQEWTAEGVPARSEDLQALDGASLPWWMDTLSNNESIAVSEVSQLPPSERLFFEQSDALAVLALPVFVHESLHGFLSFEETKNRREWKSEEIGFLRNAAEILGRAIERVEAEQFLHQRNLELATLNAVAQALSVSLDLKDLLDEALSRTVNALGFSGGLVALADTHRDNLALSSYTGLPPKLVQHMQTHGMSDTLCNLVYNEGTPLRLTDLRQDCPVNADPLLEAGLRSYAGTPIVHKEHVLGTLSLFSQARRATSESEQALLTAIGQQIGLAVENARLFEDVTREREVAHTLLDTAEALSTTLQLDRLLERVLDELQRVVPYDSASISLLHHDQSPSARAGEDHPSTAWIVASRGFERTPSQGFVWEELPLIRRVVQEHAPAIVPDVDAEPAWRSPVEELGPVRSWLCVPLISKNKTLGLLMIDSHRPNAYDEETARLAFAFAHHAAIAIDNSRLYEQTRVQLREAVLLHGVTAALSATLDLDQMLPYLARSLCEAMNSSRVELYELNEKTGDLTVVAHYATLEQAPAESSSAGQTRSLSDFHAAAEALSWDRPLQVRIDDSEIDAQDKAVLADREAQAALLLPIAVHGHTLGLAAVWESDGPRRFAPGEIALGQTLIHQAAIAMENASLFEATREQVQRTELLLEASKAATSTLDSTEVLQRLAEAVAQAIGADMTAVCLLNEDGTALRPVIGHQVPPRWLETYRGLPIPIEEHPFVEEAWRSRQPIYTSAAPDDPRLNERTRQLFPGESILLIPMTVRDEIIGGLWATWWEEAHPFVEEELQLTEGIVRQAAVAIQHARLFEEVEAARVELQQRAEALQEANVRLQELDRLKSQFLANMSHELRTPLNSVIGFSEVLVDGLMGELSAGQKECAENILGSGEHLLALINDILDLSKIEAGHVTLEPTSFDVTEWIREVQGTVKPLFDKKAQVLEMRMGDNLPSLTADPFRIKQVLLNLLSNANKFTPEEGRVTLACHMADPNTMLFAVSDTGIGIKPEDQEIIFEEFRQAGDFSEKVKGTGLGLTISRKLIEMHGGRIWVESEPGHGATFSFLLPVTGPPDAEAKTGSTVALSTQNKTVLVVEDDRQFSNLLAFYLRQEGYTPVQHYTGAEVLERTVALEPAFITLDLMLPEQDGWKIISALKSDRRTQDIPILVITAVKDGQELALSLGAADYLAKPVHRSDVQNLLKRMKVPAPEDRKTKVLLVDDDPDVIQLLEEMLLREHYETLVARDGQQGLDAVRDERPDMIILDLVMPGATGFEMLTKLRDVPETADIPVIVLTAIDVTPEQRRFLDENTQGILLKSQITPQVLLAELRRLEEQRRQTPES